MTVAFSLIRTSWCCPERISTFTNSFSGMLKSLRRLRITVIISLIWFICSSATDSPVAEIMGAAGESGGCGERERGIEFAGVFWLERACQVALGVEGMEGVGRGHDGL